ncbi:MAG TPA: DoxX family protein [Puia sp.]|nr:DoxX family protein [Puia sp.]
MKQIFSPNAIMLNNGIACIRILVGIFLIYHGSEIFITAKMQEYAKWDIFKKSAHPSLMPYIGKGSELIAGILLALGLFTRLGSLMVIGTMLYISFIIGNGKIWYDDQYPFLFAVLGFVFIFTGPGNLSIDKILFKK